MEGNKFFKKFMDYAYGSGIVLLLGFISSPINTRLFSPEDFGKFSMFMLFANVVNIIILMGLDQSFIRFFNSNRNNQGILLFNSIKLPLIFCVILSVFMGIFWEQITKFLFSTSEIQVIILLMINNIVMVLNRFSLTVVRMNQNGKLYSFLQITQKLVNIIIVLVMALFISSEFLTLIWATIISTMTVTIIAIVKSRKVWGFKNEGLTTNTSTKDLLKFGYPLIFTFLITWLFQTIDRIFINYYNGYAELGLYAAAFSIIALLNAVQSAFTTFWVPVAYEHYEKKSNEKVFFVKVNSIVTLTMFFISILIILFKDLIIYILGEDFRGASNIMPFLVFMPLMYTISETTVLGINFKKKSHYHIIIALTSALINIIGNILLVPKYGAIGAAVSTGFSYIFFLLVRTYISNYLYKVKYQMKKLYLMTICLVFFATYATFNNFDGFYLVLAILNILLLIFLYKREVMDLKNLLAKRN